MTASDLTANSEDSSDKEPPKSERKALVLVVDDDAMVGAMTGHCLRRDRYQTEIFDDQKAALTWFAANSYAVSLLISDQNMPGMTGTELAVALRKTKHNLPVIICSGYVDAIDPKVTENGLVDKVLSKPTPTHVLLSAVRNVLRK